METLLDLATEPGAAVLRELVARVETADPAGLAALGGALRTLGEGLDGSLGAVRRGASSVGDGWQGAGADAFAGWIAGYGRASVRTGTAVDRAGEELAAVERTLAGVRAEVRRHAADALAGARAARVGMAAAGALPPGAADLAAAEAMAAPTADAQAAVARAEGEIARAARALGALATGMTAFATLPTPDASAMGTGWRPRGPSPVPDRIDTVRSRTVDPHDPRRPPGSDGDGSAGRGELIETRAPAITPGPPPTPGPAPGPAPVTLPPGPPGRVGAWIHEATGILADRGVPVDRMNPHDIATIIDRESGGDPNAVNGWDSNAARGTPSQGLMQTIGPTFQAYKLPGHGDIRDPIDNIIAGVRYAIARYGSVSRVPGVVALSHGHGYVGY